MNPSPSDVFVGVASIPSREMSLQVVTERLLPQAERIGVYLNGYERVPDFLRHEKVLVAQSQHHGNLRDNGKFFFLDRSEQRYYATVDDDILYPRNYLGKLVNFLKDAEPTAAVGVHGALYPHPVIDVFDSRFLMHFESPLPHVFPAHLLGTGTTMIDQRDWQLQLSEFGTPGMADVWFAVAARKRDASLFVVPRSRRWLENISRDDGSGGGALFHEGLLHHGEQLHHLDRAATSERGLEGLLRSLLASVPFGERFSIHQALHLDSVRRQLGFPPLADSAALEASTTLEQQRTNWSRMDSFSEGDTRALGRLLVDILADRVTPEGIEPVLALLDRLRRLAITEPSRWKQLPHAIRFDTREDRVDNLRTTLLDRGMQHSRDGARRLWTAFNSRTEVSPKQALLAERASVDTQFERLPAFAELARDNPSSAAHRLYEYFEVSDWTRVPDLTALRMAFGSAFENFDVQLPLCLAAIRSGNVGLASRMIRDLRRRSPWDIDVRLMDSCLLASGAETRHAAVAPPFRVLDDSLSSQGFEPYLDQIDSTSSDQHWIHSLTIRDAPLPDRSRSLPVVSVLMTTHNDAESIAAAIRSVLASRGVELQLVVVDDASTDRTLEIVRSIDDPRITLVANDRNVGPYLSRNRGLEHAFGRYVAIADADDWTHPQRLEYQSSILEEFDYIHACTVGHVRVRPSGHFDLENHLRFVGDGPMSLMFRRWLLDHIGGFDHIRTRGDIEFLRRLTARFGTQALASFGSPLVLATSTPRSNSKLFREESLNLYRAEARLWHQRHAGTDALYVPLSGSRAAFIAPHDLVVNEPGDVAGTITSFHAG